MKKFMTITLMGIVSLTPAITISEAQTKTNNVEVRANASKTAETTSDRATVKIVGFEYQPKTITITAGTTVEWINEGTRHSVDADDGSFKSEILKKGDKFEHTFTAAGEFPYHCRFHGEPGGKDMAGKVVVKKAKK